MKALVFILLTSSSFGQAGLGDLQGTVVDKVGFVLPFVRVVVYADSNFIIGRTETDFDGDFMVNSLVAGNYTVKIKDFESEIKLDDVAIYANTVTKLGEITLMLPEIIWCEFPHNPSIYLDPFGGPAIIKSEDIKIRY